MKDLEMEFLQNNRFSRLILGMAGVMLMSSSLALGQAGPSNSAVLQVKNNEAPALATRLQSVLNDFGTDFKPTFDFAFNFS